MSCFQGRHSRTHDDGFHYEAYGEISPSCTLSYRSTAKFNFVVSGIHVLVRENAYCIVGTAGWAYISALSTKSRPRLKART